MLSERELESRYEVFAEQYAIKLNIEAETAASIARTMILPAAARHLAELHRAGIEALIGECHEARRRARASRSASSRGPTSREPADDEGLMQSRDLHARHRSSRRWTAVRDVADRLERIVADDLWPLPKYSEMLFIK